MAYNVNQSKEDYIKQMLAKSTAATTSSAAAQTTEATTTPDWSTWVADLKKKTDAAKAAAEVPNLTGLGGSWMNNMGDRVSSIRKRQAEIDAFGKVGQQIIAPVTKPLGATVGFLHENISRPAIQATGESLYNTYNDIKGAVQGKGFGTTSNDVLIPDNPLTGQIGGRSNKEQLGTAALALSNFVGLGEGKAALQGIKAAVGTKGGKAALAGLKDLLTSKGVKTLGGFGVAGGLAGGGMVAEEKDSTWGEVAQGAKTGTLFGLGLAGLGLGVKGAWLGTKSLLNKGSDFLPKDLIVKYEEAGIADEVKNILTKSKEEFAAAEVEGTTLQEVFAKNVSESPLKNEIMDVGSKWDASKASGATEEILNKEKDKLLKEAAGKTFIQDAEGYATKPLRTTYSERASLIKDFKTYIKGFKSGLGKGLKSGAKTAKEDISASLQTAKNFIKEAIPDQGLTKGEANRLISSISKAITPKALEDTMQRAISIAEASAKRELISGLQTGVKQALSNFPKTSASMIQKAVEGKFRKSATAVAVQERNMLALLANFLKLETNDLAAVKQRSVSAFIEKNPIFAYLPKDMIESIMGVGKKTMKDFEAADLAKLQGVVDSLVEQGVQRTKSRLLTMGKTIKGSVQAMKATTGTNIDEMGTDWLSRLGDPRISTATPQTMFDLMDGGLGSKTMWQKTGTVTQTLYRPLQLAFKDFENMINPLKERLAAKVRDLGGKLTPDSYDRITIYAQSLQPKSYKKIVAEVGKDLVDSIKLTDSEMDMYLFMRRELDAIKPKLDAVYMEIHGRPIGTVEDFFPFKRNMDSIDSVAKRLEDSIGGSWQEANTSIYKKSSEFGSLKGRTGKDDPYAKLNLNALENFYSYINDAYYFANVEPAIANMRLHLAEKEFRDMIGPTATKWLDSHITLIAKKGLKHWHNPVIEKIAGALKKNLAVAYLAKMSTAMKQFSSIPLAMGYVGPVRMTEAMGDVLAMSKVERDAMIKESAGLTLAMGGDAEYAAVIDAALDGKIMKDGIGSTIGGVINKTGQKLLDTTVKVTDTFGRLATYKAAKDKGLDMFKGDVTRAIEYADYVVNRTQVSGHFSETAGIQNLTSAASIIKPFQTFVLGQWQAIRRDMIQGAVLNLKEGRVLAASQNAGIFLAFVVSMMAENAVDYSKDVIKGKEGSEDGLLNYYKDNALSSFLNTVPIIGGGLGSLVQGYSLGGSFTPLGISEAEKVLSASIDSALYLTDDVKTSKDKKKIKESLITGAEGAGSLIGAPVGGMKELYLLSKFIKDKFGTGQAAPTPQVQNLGGGMQNQYIMDLMQKNQ